MERKAGMSAGRTMLPWRRLREESPGLFEGLLVWQQPSAFADAVTFSWQIRQEAAECQQQVRLVDAFAGAWTAEAKEQQWLLQQMQACVAPGCTAVSQITDTGLAAAAKQAAEEEKERIRELLRLKAKQEGVEPRQPSSTVCKQTEQHAACHVAHSIMQSRQSSTVHSRAAQSMQSRAERSCSGPAECEEPDCLAGVHGLRMGRLAPPAWQSGASQRAGLGCRLP